ncbi:MAG: HlyD family efflux transporter periplasmic adaptor subunit [Bacteroidia bacterium]|nr:HlyD family efflux transporter periplasmic adaptor subunit [Bacteroidia bacterium]
MRKTILSVVGSVIILALSFLLFSKMSGSKHEPERNTSARIPSVTVKAVQNSSLPIQIQSTGSITAKDRIVLYSEVQGVFETSGGLFKPGSTYKEGQTLIQINNKEFVASVKSQRVAFKSLVTSLLADIQFDYPSHFEVWRNYVNTISANSNLPELPEIDEEALSNYLTVKSVYANFYSIKNLEARLIKYRIAAPFTGVLVGADVTTGTLVSPGQKLGEFVRPGLYELELNVNAGLIEFLQPGKKVNLRTVAGSKQLQGTVSRINAQVNRASQTVKVYVGISNNQLREGEYLEANVEAMTVDNIIEIPRNLIVDQNHVFLVKGDVLQRVPVSIVHSYEKSVVIKGLKDGDQLVTMLVPGGYDGMKVTIRK